jgi:hypothetical protein
LGKKEKIYPRRDWGRGSSEQLPGKHKALNLNSSAGQGKKDIIFQEKYFKN